MKLFLHVGTEKTGSSYLQNLCATGRPALRAAGIFFPDAGKDESRLIAGPISPGNARSLSDSMKEEEWDKAARWIGNCVDESVRNKCHALLLSHELLFKTLSLPARAERLHSVLSECGISSTSLLLIIREPVDQAISLYKHRAKNGRIAGLADWLQTNYSLVTDLQEFFRQIDGLMAELHIRKYSADSTILSGRFFDEWLGVSCGWEGAPRNVNPSLSFSELALIKFLARYRPRLVPHVARQLQGVPKESKAKDLLSEKNARAIAEHILASDRDFWEDVSQRLSHDGGLAKFGDVQPVASTANVSEFSETQLEAISAAISKHGTLNSIAADTLRAVYGRVRFLLSGKPKRDQV